MSSTARIALVMFFAAACAKGGPAQQTAAPVPSPAPEPSPAPPPVAEKAPPDDGDLTVTTSSPEALAHFKQGRELLDRQREAESVEHFKKALELDPAFAQATLYLARVSPGAERLPLLEKAVEQAKGAPEPERQYIEAELALAESNPEKARGLLRKAAEARPHAWRVLVRLANLAFGDENWDEAVSASKRAVEASPEASPANNYIAYGLVWQGRYPEAIAVAEKQIAALPGEPNPLDTLGEILLAAGKLDEALAAFEKAVAASPKFTIALEAVAVIHVYKGDWKGAYDALQKAHDGAPRLVDALEVAGNECWLLAAQGKLADAQKILAVAEKKATEANNALAALLVGANRAFLLSIAGKPKDAQKALDASDAALRAAGLPPAQQREVAALIGEGRLILAMKAKKGADADKIYAALETDLSKEHVGRGTQSALDFGKGLAAWAKGDAKGAVESLQKCSAFDFPCRFMMVSAQRAAGDKAGAADTLAKLKASPRRDPTYAYFWVTAK